jgi:hypothetical protein
MKKAIPVAIFTASNFLFAGCVMPPLSNDVTARSLGKGNWSTTGGIIFPEVDVAYIRQGYGVTDNLDVGVLGETGINNVVGGWGQYSIINQPEGFSFAIDGGAGGGQVKGKISDGVNQTTTGYYGYIGPIVSYKTQYLEPYVAARVNYLKLNNNITPNNADDFGMDFVGSQCSGILTVGTTLWFNNYFGVTVSANGLATPHDGFAAYGNAGLVLRY